MLVGQKVVLKRDAVPWYSGYGTNPQHVLRAGSVGTVTHVNVPAVTSRRTYHVARFGSWQVDFTQRDVEIVRDSRT